MDFKLGDKVITDNGFKGKVLAIYDDKEFLVGFKSGGSAYYLPGQLKPRFPWKKFKNGEFAVHCKTKAEARNFFKHAEKHGCIWTTGKTLKGSDTRWTDYKESTLYDCEWDMKESGTPARICYSGLQELCKKNRKKVEWSDYMKPDLHQTVEQAGENIVKGIEAVMNPEERFKQEYLKHLRDGGYNWIARDKYGSVYAYGLKPVKNNIVWDECDAPYQIDPCLIALPEIQWEDTEPTPIEDLIKEEK